MIKINIPDPNLFNAVQDSIEDMGGYIDIQLNRKILCVRKEYLLELVYVAAQDEDIKTIENVINDALKEAENNGLPANSDLLQKIKIISSIGADIASIITSIADLCSPSSILTKTLKTLLGFIK